jgi:hypothetical protein
MQANDGTAQRERTEQHVGHAACSEAKTSSGKGHTVGRKQKQMNTGVAARTLQDRKAASTMLTVNGAECSCCSNAASIMLMLVASGAYTIFCC